MKYGEHTKLKKAESYYNELWQLEHRKKELIKELREVNERLIQLQ